MDNNKISDSEWVFIHKTIEEISIANKEKAIELHDVLAEFIAKKVNESFALNIENFTMFTADK